MRIRPVLSACLGLGAGALAAFAAWLYTLPPVKAASAPPVPNDEVDATLVALKPPKRARPLVAIIAINDATETTDYLVPFGILRRADVADVMTVATGPGPVKLFPALTVDPHATVAQFDAQHPDGADYVIVPAMSRDDDPAALHWLRSQDRKGAIIIGVCAGAKVLAAAGLLGGRRATTHWYYRDQIFRMSPTAAYVANRRFVVDGRIVTTTGITASMPISLTLIEAIAGRERAESVALGIGLDVWDARHASRAFAFTRPFALTVLTNTLAFWNREQLGVELSPEMDEVSLALVADAWSRTYRSRAVTFARTDATVTTRNGIRVHPDRSGTSWPLHRLIPAAGQREPANALDDALHGIERRYGSRTADMVAVQLEHQRRGATASRKPPPATSSS